MGFPTTEILGLIYRLLPGFLAAWIFYGLTAHPKKDMFERTVQALILTGIVRAIVIPSKFLAIGLGQLQWNDSHGRHTFSLGEWTDEGDYCLSVLVGVLIGFVFAYCANNNTFHNFIRNRIPKITKRTSYPSEWFSAFNGTQRYVYLHLDRKFLNFKDEDKDLKVFGWPEEWPDSPENGHFVLMQAEWIAEDNTRTPLPDTERLLIPAKAVLMVELMIEYIPQVGSIPSVNETE